FIFMFSILGVKSGALSKGFKHSTGQVLSYSYSMTPQALLADTNAQRQENNDSTLVLSNKLSEAAQAKASDMASRDYWSHETPDGNPPWVFFNATGYEYQKAGENLASGFSNERSVVD